MNPAPVNRVAGVLPFPAPGLALPEPLAKRWTATHNQYTLAFEAPAGEAGGARVLAVASAAVAALWRDIARVLVVPQWAVSAAHTAAEAFENQARDWNRRADFLADQSTKSGALDVRGTHR